MSGNGAEPAAGKGTTEPVAVVDSGSNSTRLLITGPEGDITRRSVVTGLGRGVETTHTLSSEAIDRTTAVLEEYRACMDQHDVSAVRAVSTAAARDATNRDEFLRAATQVLGETMHMIDGSTEGRLAFAGATGDLDRQGPFMVIDIGGRSTELIVGGAQVDSVVSLPMGSVRFTEQYLPSDPPDPAELSSLLQIVSMHLGDVARDHPAANAAVTHVGVAGTVTTIAAVELGLATYDPDRIHRMALTRAAVEDVFRTLATEPVADRVHNPGLPRERADVIVAGTAILVGIMRFFDVDELVVSEHDLLDGVAAAVTWPPESEP